MIFGCWNNTDDHQLGYVLHVPDSNDKDTPAPLITGMHGYGDANTNFEQNSQLT
ncbi:MAG TPA: hypothetical protein VF857_09395 [Spirochaetota bacterium]